MHPEVGHIGFTLEVLPSFTVDGELCRHGNVDLG
jgi:hypothetical protein